MKGVKSYILAGLVPLFLSCELADDAKRNGGDHVETSIQGSLFYPGGKSAGKVSVALRPANWIVDTAKVLQKQTSLFDTTLTDEKGKFIITCPDSGLFVVEAFDNRGNRVFIDSIRVPKKDTTITVPDDTLRNPGVLEGYIRTSGAERALAVIIGLDLFTVSDSTGFFRFTELAPAQYRLVIVPFSREFDVTELSAVTIVENEITLLDPIRFSFQGIPPVTGIHTSYHPLLQLISLSWNKIVKGNIGGYNVYRADTNHRNQLLNPAPFSDTVFTDSSGSFSEKTYYQVTAVDTNGVEGKMDGKIAVENKNAFHPVDTLIKPGLFKRISGAVIQENGIIWAVDPELNKLVKLDSTGKELLTLESSETGTPYFDMPISVELDSAGRVYVLNLGGEGLVWQFDSTGVPLRSWIVGKLCHSLAYGCGKLFAACKHEIKTFSPDSTEISTFQTGIQEAQGIAVSGENGLIYVSDAAYSSIVVFDMKGNKKSSIGEKGKSIGFYEFPMRLALTGDTLLFVVDSENSHVQVENLLHQKTIARFGKNFLRKPLGLFVRPTGITICSGDVLLRFQNPF